MRFLVFGFGLFGLLFGSPALSPALPSAPLPLDNWSYPALDKLAGLGLVDSALQGSRPYARVEAARQVAEARRTCEERACPAVARELIERLEGEFADELAVAYPEPPAPFRLQDRGGQVTSPDGRRYLPYLLSNTGPKSAAYRLHGSVRGEGKVRLFADRDADGLPDGDVPLPREVEIGAGSNLPFVAAVPESVTGPYRAVHVSAMAARPSAEVDRFVPLRELRLGYVHRDGEPSIFLDNDASQFAPNTLNDGIEYAEGHNLQAILESEVRLGKYVLLNWRPLLEVQEGAGASLHTLQGLAALGLGPLQLSVGRQSLRWGQGERGTLVLTDNARPLDMVRLTNPSPARLPWFLDALGPFRFDGFVSRLEEDRVVPEPWFGGLRINIRPFSWLELGASRTVIFGGDGRPDVGLDDFLTIVGGENIGGSSESNQLAAIDARIRIPALLGLELYGEYGGEDEADLLGVIPFISKKAFLLGFYLPRLGPSGRLGLRVEHADLSTRDEDSSVWYRHGTYRSGYVYKGDLLGHPVGGDGRETWAELRWFARSDLTLAVAFARQRRGETLPVQEEHDLSSLEMHWRMTDRLDLEARYVHDRVRNARFVSGEEERNHLAGVELRLSW